MKRRDFVVGATGAAFAHSVFGRIDHLLRHDGRSIAVAGPRISTTPGSEGFGTRVKVLGIGGIGESVLHHLQRSASNVVAEYIGIGTAHTNTGHAGTGLPWRGENDGDADVVKGWTAATSFLLDGTDLAIVVVGHEDAADLQLAARVATVARKAGALTFAVVAVAPANETPGRDLHHESAMNELSTAATWLVRIPEITTDALLNAQSSRRHLDGGSIHPLVSGIRGLVEILDCKLIGIDFDDLRSCFPQAGVIRHALGHGTGIEMAGLAARQVLAGHSIGGPLNPPRGILVAIAGNETGLKMKHVTQVLDAVFREFPSDIPRTYGTVFNDRMRHDALEVSLYVAHRA